METRGGHILVPIALFASCAKAPPAKRGEKGDGDENGGGHRPFVDPVVYLKLF